MLRQKKGLRGMLCTLAGGTAWGFSGTCGQYIFANSSMDSGILTAVRMLGSGIFLLLFCFITKKEKTFLIWKTPKDAVRLVLFAIFGLMFCQYAYLTAIRYSNSGTATVLQYTGIIFIMLVSCVLSRKFPERKEAAAVVCALAGVFLLATHGDPMKIVLSSGGLIWGIIAAAALVVYNMIPGTLLEKWGTSVVNGFGMLIGGLILGAAFHIWEERWEYGWDVLTAVFAIVFIGTIMAFCLYLQGVADIGPVKASMLACVEPVVAAALSAFWLGTRFTFIDLAAFAIIIGGVILTSIPVKQKKKPAEK